jgi:YVTN family beta-propeller protein
LKTKSFGFCEIYGAMWKCLYQFSWIIALSISTHCLANFAYVTGDGAGDVYVIDTSFNTVVATIPLGPSASPTAADPVGIAVTPNGKFAYVANAGTSSHLVFVIQTSSNTVVDTIVLGAGNAVGPMGVAITPNGNFAYVANKNSDTVSVIDTATNTVITNFGTGSSNPFGVAITPNGNFAYVTNNGSNIVSVIDTSLNTVVATIAVGGSPNGIAITPNGSFAYVANNFSNTVSVIDTSTNMVVGAPIPVSAAPLGVAITPNGEFVYVTDDTSPGQVSVISTASNTVVDTITVGRNPFGIAITPDGNFVYVANGISNTVSVIDTSSNMVIDTIPGLAGATWIAITPGLPAPLAPQNLTGKQKKNDFGILYELFNQLKWQIEPNPSGPAAIGYFVYRNGVQIATLSETTTEFEDHDVKKGMSNTYAIVGFDINGNLGPEATITIK